jgi:hypothetical protein
LIESSIKRTCRRLFFCLLEASQSRFRFLPMATFDNTCKSSFNDGTRFRCGLSNSFLVDKKTPNHSRDNDPPTPPPLDLLTMTCNSGSDQGCQMVYFQTKNPKLGKFWRALLWINFVHFMPIWNLLSPFGIVYGHLVLLW